MLKKYFAYFVASILLMLGLSGCAGLPGKLTGVPGPSPVEIKLMETNKALDEANQQSSTFYAQLSSVIVGIDELHRRPYWNELEQILLEYPALKDPDDETAMTDEARSRLQEWGARWKIKWEPSIEEYLGLVDRCAILEASRLAARERLLAVQAGYLSIVMQEASAGREKQAKEIYAVVEALDKSGAELDSYQPDDLGLYKSSKMP